MYPLWIWDMYFVMCHVKSWTLCNMSSFGHLNVVCSIITENSPDVFSFVWHLHIIFNLCAWKMDVFLLTVLPDEYKTIIYNVSLWYLMCSGPVGSWTFMPLWHFPPLCSNLFHQWVTLCKMHHERKAGLLNYLQQQTTVKDIVIV